MRKVVGVGLVSVLLLAGCVNHEQNASRFCKRVKERFTLSIDEQGVPDTLPPRRLSDDERKPLHDQLDNLEQTFNKSMKYSEDGTKAIRNKARDVDDAYVDVNKIVGDKHALPKELRERRKKLSKALTALAGACSTHT